jgi:peptide/nickel transport system permease protein
MRHIGAFLLRRLASAAFLTLAMYTVAFVLFWLVTDQPAWFVYPQAPHLTPYMISHGNQLLGADKPKVEQYFIDMWNMVAHDFGKQWSGATITAQQTLVRPPIGPTIQHAFGTTLSLVLGGALLVVLLSVPLGALAGRRPGSATDRTITLLTLIGICTHPMVVGLILRSIFGDHLGWAPQQGYCFLRLPSQFSQAGPSGLTQSGPLPCHGVAQWAGHLVLPWITFALLYLALYTRMIRASVIETTHEDFVRTARAKGARESRVFAHHVLPSASLRVLTMVGMEVGTAIGICVYIESAFRLNGLGQLALFVLGGANRSPDLPLVLAVVTVITAVVVVGSLLVDLLTVFVDPRARLLRPQGDAAAGRRLV